MSTPPALFLPFSLFVTSVIAAKVLHIYIHLRSLSLPALLVFLPTLLLSDFLCIAATWLLCFGHRGNWAILGSAVVCVLALVGYGAAAMSWGFFFKTGGEVDWKTSLAIATDPQGVKVLISESESTLVPAISLLAIASLARPLIFTLLNACTSSFGGLLRLARTLLRPYVKRDSSALFDEGHDSMAYEDVEQCDTESASDASDLMESEKQPRGEASRWDRHLQRLVPRTLANTKFRIFALITISYIIRPAKPYNHLSTTLPLQLLDVFKSAAAECEVQTEHSDDTWPLPELISKRYWKVPDGDFKGWAPGNANEYISGYKNRTPGWIPDEPMDGFYRWQTSLQENPVSTGTKKSAREKCVEYAAKLDDYNPVSDPLRITNLDLDYLEPLREVFEANSAVINHVMIVQMESLRQELFPLIPGSHTHKMILETSPEDEWISINEKLELLTRNSQKITGHFGSFSDDLEHVPDESTEHFGGINVNGALTGSSFSFKSFVGSQCGVWPIPVNMLEETKSQIYQPCLPHILNLFNAGKDNAEKDVGEPIGPKERKWKSIFMQSITDGYDRQGPLNKQIGFDKTVTKETLEEDPLFVEEEINYFGYPERAIKPHMQQAFQDAIDNNERLFLSHFTSTTHHPWATPEDFEESQYMGEDHTDFNQHLNSIRFHDEWLGEILELVEDLGVANETLIVFVGDHATSFFEDGPIPNMGPFENGHSSNWRVPLAFRHPQLPRIQLDVNATSISILPTILDLLIQTGSLNGRDKRIAADLAHDYEGQSLIRPYVTHQDGRRAWNFGIVNSGGGIILITSADAPWKMTLPLKTEKEYSFVDLMSDPMELDLMESWVFKDLVVAVRAKHGEEAAKWMGEAKEVIGYFISRQHRLWKYVF